MGLGPNLALKRRFRTGFGLNSARGGVSLFSLGGRAKNVQKGMVTEMSGRVKK